MADEPKPVAQEVEEKETTDEEVKSEPQSNAWFESLPSPIQGALKAVGADKSVDAALDWLEENQSNPVIGFALDKASDYIEQLREAKDNLIGPPQISFSVKEPARTGDDDRNNAHNSSLRYPRDSVLGSTEYMLFQFYRYEAPFGRGGAGTLDVKQFLGAGSGEYSTLQEYNLATQNLSPDTQLNQVVLYMPPDISSSYAASWGEKSFSNTAVAKIRGGMALRRGNIGGAAVGQLDNLAGGISRMPELEGAKFIRNEIAKATGEQFSRNDLFSSSAGVVLNPNTEMLFQNPTMRTIDFTFKMVPNNKDEAEIIFEIVRTFKLCLHASFGIPGRTQGTKPQGLGKVANTFGDAKSKVGFISVPSVCKFTFMKGNDLHPFLPQYKTCALVSVDVNYTTDGQYVVTKDGYPVATEMRLSFQELKLVYREDIMPVKSSTGTLTSNKNLAGGH